MCAQIFSHRHAHSEIVLLAVVLKCPHYAAKLEKAKRTMWYYIVYQHWNGKRNFFPSFCCVPDARSKRRILPILCIKLSHHTKKYLHFMIFWVILIRHGLTLRGKNHFCPKLNWGLFKYMQIGTVIIIMVLLEMLCFSWTLWFRI